jgi:hypothetical protein
LPGTKRRRLAPIAVAIPLAAVEAWRAGDRSELNELLAIKPWEISPFDAGRLSDQPPHRNLARAVALREQLEALAGQPGGRR